MIHTGTDSGFQQQRWTRFFFGAALIIFAASGWAWWHYVRSNTDRTFYAAIENSLRSDGFSKHITQENGEQKLHQGVRLGTGAQNVAQSDVTIMQSGEATATIKTEAISTPREEYVRYTQVQTNEKKADGSAMDFSQLVNRWGKSEAPKGGDQYIEATLNVVPAGRLSAEKRAPLMKLIRDKQVYKINNVQRGLESGRPVYTYDITVATENYVQLLKDFDKATGLGRLEQVEPSNYKDSEPMTFQLKVDVWGQQLKEVSYGGGQRVEHFGSYGIVRKVEVPHDAVPVEELQSLLQAAQQ